MFDRLFSHFTWRIKLKIGEYFFCTTENQNRTRAFFLQFVLWHYRVIMIRKHGGCRFTLKIKL